MKNVTDFKTTDEQAVLMAREAEILKAREAEETARLVFEHARRMLMRARSYTQTLQAEAYYQGKEVAV